VTGPARRRPRIHPIALFIVIALTGSIALTGYAFATRNDQQVPLLATAAAILGVVLIVLAVVGAVATYRAARDGRGGRAVVMAIAGGVAAMAAAGVLAAATILGLLYHPD
jgi:hypothetical protein